MSDWTYPLFGCFSDCTTCLLAWWCPCILVGRNAEAVGEDRTLCCLAALASLYFFPAGYLIIRTILRSKVRESKGIQGSSLKDCICVYFCDICAHTQETRELESPGGQSIMRK